MKRRTLEQDTQTILRIAEKHYKVPTMLEVARTGAALVRGKEERIAQLEKALKAAGAEVPSFIDADPL